MARRARRRCHAVTLSLIVEDLDAPNAKPFCPWLGYGLEQLPGYLEEGRDPPVLGRNSYQKQEWLAPDPPTGHGTHDYVFQLSALSSPPALEKGFGRSEFLDAVRDHIVGIALLTGTYERQP